MDPQTAKQINIPQTGEAWSCYGPLSRLEEVQKLLEEAHRAKYPERYDPMPPVRGTDAAFDAMLEAIRACAPNPFADARRTMADAFKDKRPGSVWHTYVANVAVIIQDESKAAGGPIRPSLAYELAEKILHLIFLV